MELTLESLQPTESCSPNQTGYDAFGATLRNGSQGQFNISCTDSRGAIPYQVEMPALKYVILVFYLGTFLFGLCGNSLVIYIITVFKKIRVKSVANYYIRNLAFADLLFVLALPLFCWATYTHKWPMTGYLGEASCKIAYICRDINKFASVFTLVALSIDRCLASYHHLGVFRTIQVGKGVCVCIWLSCVAISTPYIMYARTVTTRSGSNKCLLAWPSAHSSIGYMTFWTSFQLVLGLVVPSVVIFTSHAVLCRRIKRIAGRNGKSTIKKPCRRMTQTVLAAVVTFVLCQIPYHVIQLVALNRAKISHAYKLRGEQYLPPAKEITLYIYLNAVAQVLIFISSCCNPIIYGLLNENFRKLYQIVLCRSRCRQTAQQNEQQADDLEPNFDIDGPYTPIRFRFEISFHLPCIGIRRLKHGRLEREEDRNKIELQTDITHGVPTAETGLPVDGSEAFSS